MKKFTLGLLLLMTCTALVVAFNAGDEHESDLHEAELQPTATLMAQSQDTMNNEGKIIKTEEEWKALLTSAEYRILRQQGTEFPFTNEYWDHKEEGIYYCAACGNPIYSSEHKYKSGTGWPSFWQPIRAEAVEEREDNTLFMTRTEIVCARCESHLGHVFNDGPEPTGLRYCMNSTAMDFVASESDAGDTTEM